MALRVPFVPSPDSGEFVENLAFMILSVFQLQVRQTRGERDQRQQHFFAPSRIVGPTFLGVAEFQR
jgi:hypothetical protein